MLTRLAPAAPTERRGLRAFDAVALLLLMVGLNLLVPARAVIPPFGAAGRPSTLIGLACLFWWLIEGLRPISRGRGFTPLHVALAGILVSALLSVAIGLNRAATATERLSADRAILGTFATIGITLMAADNVRSRHDIERILRWAVTAGSMVAVVAIFQFGFGFSLEPTRWLIPPGFQELAGDAPIEWRGGLRRVAGTTKHPIELGVVSAGLLLFALHFAFNARDRIDAQRRWIEVVLLSAAMAVSLSRSGVLTLTAGGLVMLGAWTGVQRIRAALAGLVGLGLFYVLDPRVLNVFIDLFANVQSDSSIEYRTRDYEPVGRYVSESPITGRGIGTFIPSEYFILDNQMLGTLIQSGIIGLIALVSLYVCAFVLPRHVRAMVGNTGEVAQLAQTMAGVVFAGFVATFTFDSHGFPVHRTLLFLVMGLGAALWRLAREGALDEIATPAPRPVRGSGRRK